MQNNRNPYKDVLFGVSVGDAVGVPYEFRSREEIARNPAVDMIGFGTHNQPPGTWSDDASLTFCLADALADGFDLNKVAENFTGWYYRNLWTARGFVFDVGITTQHAIGRLAKGTRPDIAGDFEEEANGNGSLMRILPLLFYIRDKPVDERFAITRQVSSITHGHVRSVIACFYYLEFAARLLDGDNAMDAYHSTNNLVSDFLSTTSISKNEIAIYDRLLDGTVDERPIDNIRSSGYVVNTLMASVWCLLTSVSYREAILKAVNLGDDTDTTAAVTGGLAALLYGYETIPADWILKLARLNDIEALAERLKHKYDN